MAESLLVKNKLVSNLVQSIFRPKCFVYLCENCYSNLNILVTDSTKGKIRCTHTDQYKCNIKMSRAIYTLQKTIDTSHFTSERGFQTITSFVLPYLSKVTTEVDGVEFMISNNGDEEKEITNEQSSLNCANPNFSLPLNFSSQSIGTFMLWLMSLGDIFIDKLSLKKIEALYDRLFSNGQRDGDASLTIISQLEKELMDAHIQLKELRQTHDKIKKWINTDPKSTVLSN